jgi:hypothetical protein
MKYPRLPPELDRRRKLMPEDIAAMRRLYHEMLPQAKSERQVLLELSEKFGVSYECVYYWTHDDYREWKRKKNAEAHSKRDIRDYVRHRARELRLRAERMKRHPPLKLWHAVVGAKNEKRCKRHTVHGIPLETLLRGESV